MNHYLFNFFIFLFVVSIFISCSSDNLVQTIEPNQPITNTAIIEECNTNYLINYINETIETNNYVVDFRFIENGFQLQFLNGTLINICDKVFDKFEKDAKNWNMEIFFIDGQTIELFCKGEADLSFNLNPSGYNPLCGILSVSNLFPTKKRITLIGKNGESTNVVYNIESLDSTNTLPIFGLYENYNNKILVELFNESDILVLKDSIFILTQEIASNLVPNIAVYTNNIVEMQPGFNLVSSFHHWPNVPFMFDAYGNIRWILNTVDHPQLNSLSYDVGIEQLQNGNLYFGDISSNTMYEIDFFGNMINTWSMPTNYQFHHNIQEKPDGNFLVTASKWGDLHQNFGFTIEDHILELDRQTGNITKSWDLKYFADENRNTMVDIYPGNQVDWFHANAVIYDESDNAIIVSGRHQAIIKIGYDDEVKWILGNHTGWGQNRNNEETSDFLLTAIDDNGNAYNNQVQIGNINDENFEWNWYQHAVMLHPNGNLMCFDNGDFRNFNFNNNGNYSRAVEYEIDEINKTVKQVWTYGKERGKECFARIISDVDYNMETNNVIFAPGFGVEDYGQPSGGRIVELDYTTKQVFFDAVIQSNAFSFHRVEKINLY